MNDSIEVVFEYDPNATDLAPDPNFGTFLDISGHLSATIGTQTFSGNRDSAEVRNNDSGNDVVILYTPMDSFPDGWAPNGGAGQRLMTFALLDPSGTVFDGDTLPSSIDLSDYNLRLATINFLVGATFPGGSTSRSILIESATEVPEPSSEVMFAVGSMCVLGWLRRRRAVSFGKPAPAA